MQKGRVLSLRQFGIIEVLQKNSFLILLSCSFIFGIMLGVFLFDDLKAFGEYPKEYIAEYISMRTDRAFIKILFSAFLESLSVLFLAFLLGASLFGVVTVPSLVVLKGFIYGGITSYLYSAHGIKGIAFNAIIFIPSIIIFIIVLLVAARESIRFSLKLSSLTLNKTMPFSLSQNFRDYSIKYIIFAVVTLVSSLVDALVSVGLIKYFTL